MFRIRTARPSGTLVHTILNAKHQTRGKSCVRDLADGAFLRLSLKPPSPFNSYFEIDVARLEAKAIDVKHNGRAVDNPEILSRMATEIATQAGWNLSDYSLESTTEANSPLFRPRGNHSAHKPDMVPLNSTVTASAEADASILTLHDAVRHYCQDGVHEHLRVGHIRSCGELRDLWTIDHQAYGEASITYDKFEDWWRCYPFGLHALFFRTQVMGALGIWPLSNHCADLLATARLKESEITGRHMRTFRDTPARHWYISGIVLRPELIGGRAIRILLSHGVGSWLSSAKIQFPSHLLALAYSRPGESLLEGFNFFKIQNADVMPNRVPLFGLPLPSRQEFLASLKQRGLEIT